MSMRDDVEAVIRVAEWVEKKERQRTRRRRLKKAALIVSVPVLGPLAGSLWADNEARGWR